MAYLLQAVDDPGRRLDNPHPQAPVPFELIEWQCSYTQEVCILAAALVWHAVRLAD